MKHFEEPTIEILKFNVEDVITESSEFRDGEDQGEWDDLS